ncbi:MAG: methylmalonyl-CoA mutase [Nocardioidaceae bacterium]|nr:methylmalonyl-CoA mutase [Nocardioidaceae bacterium]
MSTSSPGSDAAGASAGSLRLDADPARHTREQWERAAAAVLRKSRRLTDEDPDSLVWDKLTRTTLDGVGIPPVGSPEDAAGAAAAVRPERDAAWDVRSLLPAGTAQEMNGEALADLKGGATSVWLEVGEDADFAAVCAGVDLCIAPAVLAPTGDDLATAQAFLAHRAGESRGLHPSTNLGLDPLRATKDKADLALEAGVLGFVIDATTVHDLGASDAQELGYAMAVAATYLRTLTAAGVELDCASSLVEFRFAATDEQFPTIAKLRAARQLWARMLELSGGDPIAQVQHVVTSRPMMSIYDPYVNMLRTTVAAFAAGVAGADAVTVLPFDTPLGRPDGFGRRIARNTSALLIAESHVAAVADPAGGAYAVERLTHDLAEAAWAELGRIEEAGGVEAALADGSLRARIDDVVARRDQEVATRRRPLTGLSEFPNLAETLPTRTGGRDPVRRYGAAFETLRDDPPAGRVFLATMGTVAEHTARATFAANLFAAGGVAVDVAGATTAAAGVVAAYDGQPVACLAGTDAAYAAWGADVVAALRAAGVRRVILAGRPGDRTVAADLVDDSCALGLDALAFLTRTREALA